MSSPFEFAFQARDVILGMTLLESFADGIYTAVFAFTFYLLLSQKKARQNPRRAMTLAIVLALYVLAIIHLAVRWYLARKAFVVDGKTADDILMSFLTQPAWSTALSTISFGLMTLIADCIMVWRVWVVWNRNWKVAMLPLLVTIAGTVFWGFSTALQIHPDSRLFTNNRNKFAQPAMIYFILSLTSTVLSTMLIVGRILSVSRAIDRRAVVSPYRKAIEIIVESAALYCLALIVFLPFFARDDFLDGYPQALLVAITGIAPTMIVARVTLGVSSEYHSTVSAQSTFVVATGASLSSQTVQSSTSASHSLHSEKKYNGDLEA